MDKHSKFYCGKVQFYIKIIIIKPLLLYVEFFGSNLVKKLNSSPNIIFLIKYLQYAGNLMNNALNYESLISPIFFNKCFTNVHIILKNLNKLIIICNKYILNFKSKLYPGYS